MLDMGKEMWDYIIGPMPATDFMDEFFPIVLPRSRPMFFEKTGL